MSTIINFFIILSLTVTLAYIFGLFMFITDHEENKCEMTYMFEYPQFVRISTEFDPDFRKYALYAYSEGALTERARRMHFDGIPVLFIHGNAGSYKQVRSLASLALRKSLNSRPGFHFDYFTVDLNEELSGLNGALLYEQRGYVNRSISRILQLYSGLDNKPKSVILVGHSMGGIIAQSLSENSPIVITLATPHVRSPLLPDLYTYNFYKSIKQTKGDTIFVSVSGGYNDFLIPSSLSNVRENNTVNVVSTHVPTNWLPTDHLCILWCKQLMLAINRALFDSVNVRNKRLSDDSQYILSVFQHHLIKHSGTKIQLAKNYLDPINLDNRGQWIENIYRQYSVELIQGTKKALWYMIRYDENPKHESVTILILNMESTDWVYACPAIHVRGQSRICLDGMHLTHVSLIAPSAKYKRRKLEINMHELKKNYTRMTHVVVRILPTDDPVILHVDVHSSSDRKITANLPTLFSFTQQTIIQETAENALRYDILLPQLNHITQSYKLFVEPTSCKRNFHHASASLTVPWANEDYHTYITEDLQEPMHLRLFSSKPKNTNDTAIVKLTLDSNCRYKVSVRSSISGTLSQIARFYSVLLVSNTAAVALMAFRYQLRSIGDKGECSIIFRALKEGTKPYYLLPGVKILSRILSAKPLKNILPLPDGGILAEENMDFLLLPLFLYVCSVGLVWIISLFVAVSVVVCESTVQKIALKFLARSFTGTIAFSDYLMSALQKLPVFVACSLIVLSFGTCGGVSLCLGAVFYFLKLTQMSQDYIEELVWKIIKCCASKIKGALRSKKPLPRENENFLENKTEAGTNKDNKNSKNKERGDLDSNEIEEIETKDVLKENPDDEIKPSTSKDKSKEKDNNENKAKSEDTENEDEEKDEVVSENEKDDKKEENKSDARTAIFFHLTLFFLWIIVTCLCIPSVLTWAHNFKYSTKLQPDPSFIPAIILSLCAIPLWQLELPKTQKKYYPELSHFIYFSAFATLAYASVSLYRLSYILSVVFVVVILHQIFAPNKLENVGEIEENTSKNDSFSERVKAKLE